MKRPRVLSTLIGRRVRTSRELTTGQMVIPAGSVLTMIPFGGSCGALAPAEEPKARRMESQHIGGGRREYGFGAAQIARLCYTSIYEIDRTT
jgi:hypothetical protein